MYNDAIAHVLTDHPLSIAYLRTARQAVQLMQSPKFSEKQAGYLFVSVLLTDSHELMEEVGKVVAADIRSDKQLECCLALHCVANIGGTILAKAVGESLGKLFKSRDTPPFVKKKVRGTPDCFLL